MIKRNSYEAVYEAFRVWLSNHVQRRGLKYVAVPEYHSGEKSQDKTAIHFHILSNSNAVELVDSGHYRKGRQVFNIPSWKKGFSTAIYTDGDRGSTDNTAKYICKYMTKSNGNKVGGRYYLSGGNLQRPMYVYGDSIEELVNGDDDVIFKRDCSGDWGSFRELSFI